MASTIPLFADLRQHSDIQIPVRTSTCADTLNTAQPFTFTNTSAAHMWSYVDFVPEKIVELSVTVNGLRFYKVQWHHSWVAEHQLLLHTNVLQDFWLKQENHSNAVKSRTACKTTTTKSSKKACQESSNLTAVSRANTSLATTDAIPVIAQNEIRPTSCSSIIEEIDVNKRKELSGDNSLQREVDPTLATLATLATTIKYADSDNIGESTPPAEKISPQRKSSSKIEPQKKIRKDNSKSVYCNGIEILGVKNTSATDYEICKKAQEYADSFKSKRRRFENGGTYNDPDICFFCLKGISSGKNLRLHIFNMHLKNFGQHTCEFCQSKFIYNRELKQHMKMHLDERSTVCKVCQLTFKGRSGLHKHMKTHEKESNFRCDVCHKNFKVQADLKAHCLEEHNQQITKCNVCKQKLYSGNSVYLHSMRHSGTREFVCEECGQSFKLKHHFIAHKVTHTGEMLACPFCEKKVKARTSLDEHIKAFHPEHSEQFKYSCAVCKKRYKDKGRLEKHMIIVHREETHKEEFDLEKTITQLQKKMKTMGHQRVLKAIHLSDEDMSQLSHKIDKITNPETGEARLRCRMCRQSYLVVSVMLKHIQDHRNGKVKNVGHMCKDCGVKFITKFLLQQHRKIHIVPKKKTQRRLRIPKPKTAPNIDDINVSVEKITDADGKVILRCKLCPKREYKKIQAMRKHLQEHEKVGTANKIRQFGNLCDTCGKSFKTKKRLQLHQRISHQTSDSCTRVDKGVDSVGARRTNRKRKQHLPMKLNTTGKRCAALNATSKLRLQMEYVSSDDNGEGAGGVEEITAVEENDFESCDDFMPYMLTA